ncbi:MAG: HDOD domain-containing protein [Pseudomonadota bacterium]
MNDVRLEASKLEPGMVVASDIRDRNGRFLVGKGTVLSDRHLKIINMWGVLEASVQESSTTVIPPKASSDIIEPTILEKAKDSVKKRFLLADLEHKAIQELFEICALRKAQQFAAKPITESEKCEDDIKNEEEVHIEMHAIDPSLDVAAFDKRTDQPEKRIAAKERIDPRQFIKENLKLPSLSPIFNQLSEAIDNPCCSISHIGSIVSKDPSISARMLQIVNSAFYGFSSQIDSISRAIAIIGIKELKTLALGAYAVTAFQDIPSKLINMKSFWKHSIACAVIARSIASHIKNTPTEKFFLAGLLHDIGKLVIFRNLPDLAYQAILRARKTNALMVDAELEILGFSHNIMGEMLLGEWKLPSTLVEAVSGHHSPQKTERLLITDIVHLADIMANALEFGTSGEYLVPPLDPSAWEAIGLPVGVLNTAVKQADQHMTEMVHNFLPNEFENTTKIRS